MTLLNLPFDIHNIIFSFFSPLDIIAVRKTCKSFYDATSQRIVWLYALEHMCHENTVYLPSYPMSKMGVKDLEYATTAPIRWGKLAKRYSLNTFNDCVPPSYLTFNPTFNHEKNEKLNDLKKLFLVPGGRFLITVIEGYMSMWDLGHITASYSSTPLSHSMNPVAQVYLPQVSHFTVHPSPDGESIRVLTYDRGRSYEIFEIYPSKPHAEFVEIASLTVPTHREMHFTSMCGDLLVLVYGPIVKVWNFITQGWAIWRTPQIGLSYLQNLVTPDGMVFIDTNKISVYDMPKLSGNAQEEVLKPEPTDYLYPRRTLSFPGPFIDQFHLCGCVSDWYTGSPQPLWFDAILQIPETVDEVTLKFSRFEAEVGRSDETVEEPVEFITEFDFQNLTRFSWTPYRVFGDMSVFLFCETDKVCFHISPSSLSVWDKRSFRITTALNIPTSDAFRENFDFCPVSGRLASFDQVDGEMVVNIHDFLSIFPTSKTGSHPQTLTGSDTNDPADS